MHSRHHPVSSAPTMAPSSGVMALLESRDPAAMTGAEVVEAMASWEGLARYASAQVLRCSVEAGRAVGPHTTARTPEPGRAASEEMRARLVLSRSTARRRWGVGEALVHRLPAVLAALAGGDIDEPRAAAFTTTLAALPDALALEVCDRVLPEASGLVRGALIDRIEEVAAALDPDWARKRERAAEAVRRVRAWRHRSGTAALAGYDLPADRVAGGSARLEILAATARRRGACAPIDTLRADAFMGLLDGLFAGFDDDEIVDILVAAHTEDDAADIDPEDMQDVDPEGGDPEDVDPEDVDPEDVDPEDGGDDAPGSGGEVDPGHGPSSDSPSPAPAGELVPVRAGERAPVLRGRVEVRGRLSTLIGLDDLPGEIAGLGPITPVTLRRMVADRRVASWRVVVTDDDGHFAFVDVLRRRPRTHHRTHRGSRGARPSTRGPGDVVEIAVPADLLRGLNPDDPINLDELPATAEDWFGLLREVCARYRSWCDAGRPVPTETDPRVRFAHAALARWVRARDRFCIGPACGATAVELDHTVDHQHLGPTAAVNLAGPCGHHHQLKTLGGWTLEQPHPGHVRWTSRAGAVYDITPRPVLRDLPDPRPPAAQTPFDGPELRADLLRSDHGDPTGATSSIWETGPDPPTPTDRYPDEPPF